MARVDFTHILKAMTVTQLQALTEEDLNRYVLAIPDLILLCTSRDLMVKECVGLASERYSGANMGLSDRIMEDRQSLLQAAESFNRQSQEFKSNLVALRPLSRVLPTQTTDSYQADITRELQALTSQQESLLTNFHGSLTSAQVQAYVQLRTRVRELEALKTLLLA